MSILFSDCIVKHFNFPYSSKSLRHSLYHQPKFFIDFSDIKEMGTSLIWNLCGVNFCLIMDILLDLLTLNSIPAHVKFECSLFSSLLAHLMVGVISSIEPRRGGRRCPVLNCSPPITYLDACIITSIAIMKANGDIVHPTIIPTSNNCWSIVYSGVVRQNCRSMKKFCTHFVIFIGTQKKLNTVFCK